MSLDDALFLVRRGNKNYHSKGSDIDERMVAGDSVWVQRDTKRFKATYDGGGVWDKIKDDDLLLAWDGTKNRKVLGANFKSLFTPPPTAFAVYRKFSGRGSITTSCGSIYDRGKGRANPASLSLDHRLFEIDSDGNDIKELVLSGKINFPIYVSNSKYPTYKLDDYNGLHSSGCTLSFAGSSEREWKVPWRIGDTREYSYIIKLHESADVPFLEWEWHPDSNLTVTDGIARTAPRSQYSNPYVYFGIRDLLEPDTSDHSVIAKQVFDNLYKDPAEGKLEENIWLKVDKGPAVKIGKNMHSISTVNGKLTLRENNYIYANSLLKFLYLNPPEGDRIKFYYHDPDRDKKEFKGIYYIQTSGSTSVSETRISRLDWNGNFTTGNTSYGIFIPFEVLNNTSDDVIGLHQFHPFAKFEDIDRAYATWQGEPAKMFDVTTVGGNEGIRVVGQSAYTRDKPGTQIYGINCTRN